MRPTTELVGPREPEIMLDARLSRTHKIKIPLLNHCRHVPEGITSRTRLTAYTCQVSLLIILNARNCPAPRLVRHSDSQRAIEVDFPSASHLIPLLRSPDSIGTDSSIPIQPGLLDVLEETLVGALCSLHAKTSRYPSLLNRPHSFGPHRRPQRVQHSQPLPDGLHGCRRALTCGYTRLVGLAKQPTRLES
ncbi:hypothetical protein GGR58DRAFT_494747 [Xylaria digitata]|nr:hypothetical protein GGR58DRAFT_494747 [Xylaria digitata]